MSAPPEPDRPSTGGLIDSFGWIRSVLAPKDRRRWKALMLLSAVVGLFEAAGVLSILPFLAIVADPGLLERPGIVSELYRRSGFETVKGFQFFLGILVFIVLVTGIALRMGRIVLHTRFARSQAVSLSLQLLRTCLYRPYGWFLKQNSARISSGVLSEVERVVTGALTSSIELVATATVTFSVIAILFVADPVSALLISVILGGAYGVILRMARWHLGRLGAERLAANRARYTVVNEVLGGIKEVKLHRLEETFLDLFRIEADKAARARATITQISYLPRNMLEILIFGGMLAFVLFVLARENNDLVAAIPILGLFAFAGARLFPVIQALYSAYATLLADAPALQSLRDELSAAPERAAAPPPRQAKLPLNQGIELCDIVFSYQDERHPALQTGAAWIPAGAITAIAGPSGAGKSTLVDLLLGLLVPEAGQISIDGVPLDHTNRAAWQVNIGYVPQSVYLMDDTVAANIAFGRDKATDDARIRRAAQAAAIDEFILGMPEGYQTRVGERGVRLSGGQAQRIAIARALYDDPQVLVLDEPTSALDTVTENSVLDAIAGAGGGRTVLIVTHREATIEKCANVIRIADGRVVSGPKQDVQERQLQT